MADFLVIGQIGRPHGVNGEVRMHVLTDFPERLKQGLVVYLGETHNPLRIKECRWHDDILLLGFEGCNNRTLAENYKNEFVYIRVDDLPSLPEGEYYHHQLIGLQVFPERESKALGVVSEILQTGANDVLVVRNDDNKEILLPILDQTVKSIDIENGKIHVHLLPGILDI